MVNTTLPLRWKDVDFQLDSGGEVFRAKSIDVGKTINSEDLDQMGTDDIDVIPGAIVRTFSIVIDELAGNWTTFDSWCDGSTTHDLKISKASATLTLTNAKCFDMSNSGSTGAQQQITITGRYESASV